MASKVTFNPYTRIISVVEPPDVNDEVFLDIKVDLYSDGKEDWLADPVLRRLRFPISVVGGDPLPGSKELGSTFFLQSDWKVRPYEASHRFLVNGNFYSVDGTSPFTQTLGTYNVLLEQQVSSLVDSTVQQLDEITYGSFGDVVTIDVVNGFEGTEANSKPVGTKLQPSKNLLTAHGIAETWGFSDFSVIGNLELDDVADFGDHTFHGDSPTKTTINILPEALTQGVEIYFAHVTGTLDGGALLSRCMLDDLNYFNGFLEQCVLTSGVIYLAGGAQANMLDCWSIEAEAPYPIVDMGGSGQSLVLSNYNGSIKIRNKTGTDTIQVNLNSGQVMLDNTVTAGTVNVKGVGSLVDINGDDIPTGTWNGVTIENTTIDGPMTGLSSAQATELTEIHQMLDVIEGGFSHKEVMRILLAALAGKASGADSAVIRFRDIADNKDRITATVDANGNRQAVTLDVS